MISRTDAEKLNKARGVSIRFDRNGRATGIQISFTYKGVQCREAVGFEVSQAGVNAAKNKLGRIKEQIAQKTFFYADFFPKSKKLSLFGGATTEVKIKPYLDKYLDKVERRGLSPATIVGYKKDVTGLKTLWDIPVAELDQLTIVNFVEQSSVSKKTLRNRLSLLKCALDSAVIDKVIRINPLLGFQVGLHVANERKLDARKRHLDVAPFTATEVEKIINAAEGTEKAIISLCNATGIRSSEWIALEKQDVCLETLEIYIYEAIVHGHRKMTKTLAGQRVIPIPKEVADLLREEMNSHDSEYVFVNSQGNPWNADSFRKHQWKSIVEKAGVRYRYPYQLRHTFATRLISEGRNLWSIAKLMGHKSPQLLNEHYGNYIEEYERKAKLRERIRDKHFD